MTRLVTLAEIEKAAAVLRESPYFTRTPLVSLSSACPHLNSIQPSFSGPQVYLKLENLQTTGSFKIRGVLNQMKNLPSGLPGCVTMSAGNYGKSFAFIASKMKIPATICLPETAPKERAELLKAMGANVEKTPTSNLMNMVSKYQNEKGYHFAHPFDDYDLIAGYGSCGLEIYQDLPDADIVLVACGGGGLLSGIATALKSKKSKAKIIGVEPEGANKMLNSLKAGKPVNLDQPKTIATGLAPPFAGKITFQHVKTYVDQMILVTDDEILRAEKMLAKAGLVVEPSGSATFAALISGKIGEINGKKVVCVLSGNNVSLTDLAKL